MGKSGPGSTPGVRSGGRDGRPRARTRRWHLLLAACVSGSLGLGAGAAGSAVPPSVTLLELGSDACRSCKAMVPVLAAVRARYGGRVAVVFHDVKKEPSFAAAYRVMLIPTQIFLDARGREAFRHEGYLPLEKVEETLRKMGVE